MPKDHLSPEGEAERRKLEDAVARLGDQVLGIDGVEKLWVQVHAGFDYVGIEVEFQSWKLLYAHEDEVEDILKGSQFICRAPGHWSDEGIEPRPRPPGRNLAQVMLDELREAQPDKGYGE